MVHIWGIGGHWEMLIERNQYFDNTWFERMMVDTVLCSYNAFSAHSSCYG